MRLSRRVVLLALLGFALTAAVAASAESGPDRDGPTDVRTFSNRLEASRGRWGGAALPPTEKAAVDAAFDENDPEVTQYAYHFDIPIARALELANWMDESGKPVEAMERVLRGNFAEARLIHGGGRGRSLEDASMPAGQLRLEIRLVDATDHAAVDHIASIPRLEGVAIEVIEVPMSFEELQQIANELEIPPGKVVEFDFDAGSVHITDPEDYGLRDISCSLSGTSGGNLDGARPLRVYEDNCSGYGEGTTGFPVRFGSTYGVVTAGHGLSGSAVGADLPANGAGFVTNGPWRANLMYAYNDSLIYVSGASYWYEDSNEYDVAVIRRTTSSTSYPGRIWKWDTQEWRQIGTHSAAPRASGYAICASASSYTASGAGTYCGKVADQYMNPEGSGPGNWTLYDAWAAPFGIPEAPEAGASGSPVFYGETTYGMLTSSDGNRWAAYMRSQPIHNALEFAISGPNSVDFVCWNADLCDPS